MRAMMNRTGMASGIKSFVISIAFLFLFVVALLLDVQYLYLMAVMLALVQPLSWAFVVLLAARYSTTRRVPSVAVEGRTLPTTLTVTATGGLAVGALRIQERCSPMLAGGAESALPLDHWDGTTGERRTEFEPLLRGVHTIGPAVMETTDPLGLFTFHVELPGTSTVVVHPAPIPIRSTSVGGGGVFGTREQDGTARRGEGLEFHGVRDYRPGDSLRRVHWRTSARTGQLAVVEFERAYEQNVLIAIDARRGTELGTGRESTFEFAIKIAATIIDRVLRQGGGLVLLSQAGRVVVRPSQTTDEAVRFRLFDFLAHLTCDQETSLGETLTAHQEDQAGHCVVLTSGRDPHLEGALAERTQRGLGVRLYYLEPESFGGAATTPPTVPGATLKIVTKQHSPWEEGGRSLESLFGS